MHMYTQPQWFVKLLPRPCALHLNSLPQAGTLKDFAISPLTYMIPIVTRLDTDGMLSMSMCCWSLLVTETATLMLELVLRL